MAFTNSSVLVLTDTNTTYSYQTEQSSPISVAIPAGSTGTWKWVVSREGYSTQIGTFDTTGGGLDEASPTPSILTQANGATLFTGSTSAIINIVFDLTVGNEICYIDIADGSVTAQQVIDEIETALLTEDGCKFLYARSGSQSTYSILAGQTYLLLGSGYRIRRESTSDVNASIEAFVISADGIPLDGVNGGVQFLISSGLTAQQVYDLFTTGTNADIFKADLTGIATATDVTNAKTDIITEVNANETKIDSLQTSVNNLNDFDPAIDQVIVATNNDKTNYELANNAITSNKVANNAFNDSSFTNGYFNAINSEVDTALSDYDAPTKAELDAAQAAIITQVDANETKIDIIDTVVDSIKTKVDTLDNTDLTDVEADLEVINQGVKKASILIPHNTDL